MIMQQNGNAVEDNENPSSSEQDYGRILDEHGFSYITENNFYLVGTKPDQITWQIHTTVFIYCYNELLRRILPVLKASGVYFRIPVDDQKAVAILSGVEGYQQYGKLITVYTITNDQALVIANVLMPLTLDLKGPEIPSASKLGGLVYAEYNDPGKFDASIWPFAAKYYVSGNEVGQILKNRYKVLTILKKGERGNVYKALYAKYGFLIRNCVVKQGRRGVWVNVEEKRDMFERLKWQYEVHQLLYKQIRVPKVVEIFREDEHCYLVMEYIPGDHMERILQSVYDKRSWRELKNNEKLLLLDFLLRIIGIVEKIHQLGFVQRDLTPLNFMVTPKGEIVMIDLELMYDLNRMLPNPAFGFGTPGYMSPEQMARSKPTIMEDIYGMGGMMIYFLTGQDPHRYPYDDPFKLKEQLSLCLDDFEMVSLMAECYSFLPEQRPDLARIKSTVVSFQKSIS